MRATFIRIRSELFETTFKTHTHTRPITAVSIKHQLVCQCTHTRTLCKINVSQHTGAHGSYKFIAITTRRARVVRFNLLDWRMHRWDSALDGLNAMHSTCVRFETGLPNALTIRNDTRRTNQRTNERRTRASAIFTCGRLGAPIANTAGSFGRRGCSASRGGCRRRRRRRRPTCLRRSASRGIRTAYAAVR